MNDIQEKVALAICKDLWAKGLIDMELPPEDFLLPATVTAYAAITTFLKAAAEQGWHMRPDEATEEMKIEGEDVVGWEDKGDQLIIGVESIFRAMLAAAPPFEWRKSAKLPNLKALPPHNPPFCGGIFGW